MERDARFAQKFGDRSVTLSNLVDEARARWPAFVVDEDAFAAHLLAHDVSVHANDLYLAFAVSLHDVAALAAFEHAYIARVGTYIVRVTVDRDIVDEVKQRLREKLLTGTPRRIVEYAGKGALGGWVRIAAVRTALNLLRERTTTTDVRDEASPALDPELAFVQSRSHQLFRDAFANVLAALGTEERSMLRLHHVEGLTMDQLSRMYRTPRSTIARRIEQVRRDVLAATEQHLRNAHRLSPSEVASVIRSARSQFHLTLTKSLQ